LEPIMMPLRKLALDTAPAIARRAQLLACTVLIGACMLAPAGAQIRLSGASAADWTVLTMAPDGAWGAATNEYLSHAIAAAIARCRAMSGRALGCGAYQVSVQRGFALGTRCGDENLLSTGATLAEAAENGRQRAAERRTHQGAMGSCRQVVIVTPDGAVQLPPTGTATSGLSAGR
jgi:hypothetical protein